LPAVQALLGRPELWPELRLVALVEAQGEPFTARYVVVEGEEPVTITSAVRGRLWVTGYDLALAYIVTGRVPTLVEAYLWETGEPLPGLHPVEVFDGLTYDPPHPHRCAGLS
jgi:hypothetical protein